MRQFFSLKDSNSHTDIWKICIRLIQLHIENTPFQCRDCHVYSIISCILRGDPTTWILHHFKKIWKDASKITVIHEGITVFLVDNGMSLLCLSLETSSTEWHFVLLWRKSFSHVFVLGAGRFVTVSYKSVKWEVNKKHWKPSPPWQRRTKKSSRLFIKATDYFFFFAYFREYE